MQLTLQIQRKILIFSLFALVLLSATILLFLADPPAQGGGFTSSYTVRP